MSFPATIFDPNDFLHSLCVQLVAQAAALSTPVTLQYAGTPRSLWRNLAREDDAADPYTVLRPYAGSPLLAAARLPRMSLQVETIGVGDEAAMARAVSLFYCFLDANGQPWRMFSLPAFLAASGAADPAGAWLIVGLFPLQRPGLTRRDVDRGRGVYGFNLDVSFKRASQI